ncbi:sialate O-acetylesterase [Hymenobacter sp. CRA2]|uniref:sialate O-acetylesterase n=1 Tax=Hymenobacter sp. CRA2 TaxID=1955620 RepID=UPI00098EC81D|nr:sialate O-acetylesterase [Hymenobacter sp. CRA2]OON67541.1 sialate O-acetylesterase [Hymenobacter sp. CRA2]
MNLRLLALLPFLALAAPAAQARVVLPRVLGHGMVLQREKPVPIWGTAAPGEAVTVQFGGQQQRTTAGADGHWQVRLTPLKASAAGAELTVRGTNEIRLRDVLVGEVWLCSGQSNMEYTMRKNSKATVPPQPEPNPLTELERAHNPQIRIFLVNRKELDRPDSLHRGWSIAQDSALRSFSAPAYFFAQELQQRLGVPVGVISSAVPGSRIEPWISTVAFGADSYYQQPVGGDPGKFYEPMIRPLAPFALRGFCWYQGESNCFLAETSSYTHKMRTLISSWRAAWQDTGLPFYLVQLAPFKYSESKEPKAPLTPVTLPLFREAQEAVLAQVPRTGLIVTTDLVTKLDDIHPPYKWEIGRRLARLALADTYGRREVAASGPVFRSLKLKGQTAEIRFQPLRGHLVSRDGQPLTGFTVASTDGQFVPAEARIQGRKVVVSATGVARPTAVRFAWHEAAQPNLFSSEGLPARPFRTDKPTPTAAGDVSLGR